MGIYLDLCAIQRPFDDAGQQRIRDETEALYRALELIREGMLELVGSFALELESDANRDPIKRGYTESVLDLANERLEPSASVQRRADVYRTLGMKAWDATHLAIAVEAHVDFFCTCDDRLLRRAKAADTGLTRAVSMLELIEEVDK
jgi:predicted nucleic acid-binding protein